jgi:hypothetical protein
METQAHYAVSYLATAANPEPTPHEQLLEAVRKMRASQKAFFAAPAGTSEKVNHLRDSRYWERVVDQLLEAQTEPQNDPQLTLPL